MAPSDSFPQLGDIKIMLELKVTGKVRLTGSSPG